MKKLQWDTLAVIIHENSEGTCICKPCWERGMFDLGKVVALITSDDIEDWKKSKGEDSKSNEGNEYRCSQCGSLNSTLSVLEELE